MFLSYLLFGEWLAKSILSELGVFGTRMPEATICLTSDPTRSHYCWGLW